MSSTPGGLSGPPFPSPPKGCPAHAHPMYGESLTKDPAGYYETLRQDGTVVPVKMTPDGTFWGWLVIGYSELLEVLRDPNSFYTSDPRVWRALAEGPVSYHPVMQQMDWRPHVLNAQGEDHTRLRTPITRALAELDSNLTRSYIEKTADELLQAFAPDGRADLVAQYAGQLPLMVLMGLLGMDEHYALEVAQAVGGLLGEGEEAATYRARVDDLMARLVDEKYRNPGQDLISWMIGHGPGLTREEMLNQAYLMLVTGMAGCTAWISNTVLELLTNPEVGDKVRGGVHSVAEAANRVMWQDPPIQNLIDRWALRDTVLGNVSISAGDLVIPSLTAANADPSARSARVDDVRNTMTNRAHLAWSGGAHSCPAQDLGQQIVHLGLERLIHRLPDVRLAVPANEVVWAPNLVVRTVAGLPVTFTPVTETFAEEPDEQPLFDAPPVPDALPAVAAPATPAPPAAGKREAKPRVEKTGLLHPGHALLAYLRRR